MDIKPRTLHDPVLIGNYSLQIYLQYAQDSAVLGFSVGAEGAPPRYFPIYGSTYRGIPDVTLDVFSSNDGQELWILSSWPGYDVLAYYPIGSDRCVTAYGELDSVSNTMPTSIAGTSRRIPDMDAKSAKRILSVPYTNK